MGVRLRVTSVRNVDPNNSICSLIVQFANRRLDYGCHFSICRLVVLLSIQRSFNSTIMGDRRE